MIRHWSIIVVVLLLVALQGCMANKKDTLASLGELNIKIDKDAPIDSARKKAEDSYASFISSAPKDSLRVEALRRLADIELEKSEERFQEQIAELDQGDRKAAVNKATEIKQKSYKKAIKLYEDAAQSSVGDVQDPQIYYQLSKAYEQGGQPEKALEALNRLLARFPDIDNRDEVHFRRGELLFSMDRFEDADRAYTQTMVVNPSSPFYEKALSKKGWSAYKQNKYDRALHSFFTLVDRKLRTEAGESDVDGSHLGRGDKELLNDIFRVITLSFNELGGARAIGEYFDNNGERDYTSRIYKNLGDHYIDQKRIRDAASTYQAFVKRYPDHVLAFDFAMYRIKAFETGGFPSLLVEAKIDFAERYKINGDYWNSHGELVHARLLPVLEQNMAQVAQHFHAKAQKSKQAEDYVEAIAWYKNFIKFFPKSEKTPNMNFLLAELLYDNKQYEEAAKEYEKTAYQYPRYGKNGEAGYAAVLAYNARAKQLDGKQKQIWERLAIASALRFGKAFPDHQRAPAVVTKAAEDLFALKKYDQAAAAARTILELTGDTKLSMRRTAWLIVAQSELRSGHYARAEAAYKIVLNFTNRSDPQRKAIVEGLAASIYKLGEQARDSGDQLGAAKHFSRVASVAPDSEIAITAQYDMAASYIAKESWQQAINALEDFRRKYPQHKLRQKVTENLALAYIKTQQPVQAAREFETMINYQTNVDVRRDMQWKIAELYEEAGNTRELISAYKELINKYPYPLEDSMEARQKLADIYLASGQPDKRRHWLREIVTKNKTAGDQRTDRTQFLAATASLELAEPRLRSFQQVKLVAPLKQNLKKKKQKMQEAVDAYTEAANYGVEEVTTASVYWLGEIYHKFGKELLKSERPGDLSPEERAQYDILLEEQAYPFEEKSINIHESNVERVKSGTYDEWVKKSFAALRALRPIRYAKPERSELFAEVIR
ncbi:MAG: tetratricopeptide repeat protein [Gammaproteobacteria bacterium]|jgi:tetratricopeptide (TPR) repeat protein